MLFSALLRPHHHRRRRRCRCRRSRRSAQRVLRQVRALRANRDRVSVIQTRDPGQSVPFRLDFPLSLSPLTSALFVRFLSSLLTTIIPSFHV